MWDSKRSYMFTLFLFGLGRLAYAFIQYRNTSFVVIQIITSVIFIGVGISLYRNSHNVLSSLMLGATFILVSLGVYLVFSEHLIETMKGQTFFRGHIGIVNFVWTFIMGGALIFIKFLIGAFPLNQPMPKAGLPNGYYQKYFDGITFLLDKIFNATFILGTVLAGCMAILWAGKQWIGLEQGSGEEYFYTNAMAIRMVIAYFTVLIGISVSIGIPLYQRMSSIIEMFRQDRKTNEDFH